MLNGSRERFKKDENTFKCKQFYLNIQKKKKKNQALSLFFGSPWFTTITLHGNSDFDFEQAESRLMHKKRKEEKRK